jgi:hypothetical protein
MLCAKQARCRKFLVAKTPRLAHKSGGVVPWTMVHDMKSLLVGSMLHGSLWARLAELLMRCFSGCRECRPMAHHFVWPVYLLGNFVWHAFWVINGLCSNLCNLLSLLHCGFCLLDCGQWYSLEAEQAPNRFWSAGRQMNGLIFCGWSAFSIGATASIFGICWLKDM